jgi:drug/metabolite transporter (DMT)-like permease
MSTAAKSENHLKGILWMLATMLCFIGLDALMKLGLERMSLVQVTWGRFLFATMAAAAYCGRDVLVLAHSTVPKQQVVRSCLLMVTTLLFNVGISSVPLATATTVMFMTPIITTVLSVLMLNELVGPRRWSSIAVGFFGAVIVVQPWAAGTPGFNVGILFLLAAAVSNAGYQIATRSVRTDDPRTSLLFTAALGALISSCFVPWHWTSPDLIGWALLVASGIAGALGHLCIIKAFRLAPASVVSPFSYSSLIWATLLGFAIWGDLPASNVLFGAALIVAAGLYIFFREARLKML